MAKRKSRKVSHKRRARKAGRKNTRKYGVRCHRKRKVGAYAKFVKAQWKRHHAKYKRMGIKKSARAIAKLWKKK